MAVESNSFTDLGGGALRRRGKKRKIKNLHESKQGETRLNNSKCKSQENAVDSRFSNHVPKKANFRMDS